MSTAGDIFEQVIWKSRLLILIAVVAGIVASFMMLVLGCVTVFWDVSHFLHLFSSNATGAEFEKLQKVLTINAVSAMDAFLIATVLFIFSVGLYELFIRKIDTNESELIVTSLDQLKDKLIKVILIVLVVGFFKSAISMEYTNVQDLLYFAVSVLVIAGAIFLSQVKLK